MRAARLHHPAPIATGPLVLDDVAEPTPGPGELLLDVAACAVCRTDLQLVEGDITPQQLPFTPGHQAVGRVVAVGDGVTGTTTGERVGVGWLGWVCGECRFCASGRENLCETAQFTGWHRDGGFAEQMLIDARFAFPLPAELADVAAAPLLCGGVIGYRSLRVSGIQPGGRLGLFGFGASASLAIQVAVHWGCEVYVATRSKSEQERARRLGAVWAGGYEDAAPVPLDAAITFAPAGDVVIAALRALDRGGVVAVNAIHLDRVPEFDYDWLWLERQIRSVANFTRRDATEFLALAAQIPVRTEVSVLPLAEANRALRELARGNTRGTAVLARAANPAG
jgi:propanol-preferring alcohol dehydrogenase